jgi:hypothetical protein
MGKLLFLDGLLEQVLTGIRAHILVVGREGYAREQSDLPSHPLDVNGPGYVLAAMTDEYAYS